MKKIEEKEDNLKEEKEEEVPEKKNPDHLPFLKTRPDKESLEKEKHAMFKKIHNRSFIIDVEKNDTAKRANLVHVNNFYKHVVFQKSRDLMPLA